MTSHSPGTVVRDRYRLDRFVASGGMGSVWQGTDLTLGQTVALKHVGFGGLPADRADESRARTLREARTGARLRGHPNVITTYDVLVDDGDVWLVQEFLPSRSLAEILDAGERLPVSEVARIGADVARALGAAHAVGVVHRDVKPGNVLVSDGGAVVKLTDFGISRAEGEPDLTGTGVVSGTPAYMACEVAAGEDATPASDVFSLGSTLYRASEGVTPFGGDGNVHQVLFRVATGVLRPPVASGPLTPVLQAALVPDPGARPDAGELAALLDAVARGRGGVAATGRPDAGATVPVPAPPPRRTGRRRLLVLGALGLVTVLAVGTGVIAARDAGPDLTGVDIVVGGRDFDEQQVLCEITGAVLESAGARVTRRCGLEGARATRAALVSGEIDLYWEYTGTAWTTILDLPGRPDQAPPGQSVAEVDLQRNGIVWLAPSRADNTYTFAVAEDRAAALGLTTQSDMARYISSGEPGQVCVEAEYESTVLPTHQRTYGYRIPTGRTTVLDTGDVYRAVADGRCLFGETFTTDGRLDGLRLRTLTDDRNVHMPYVPTPTVRRDVAERAPDLARVLDPVSAALDTATLRALDGQVSSQGRVPSQVARAWLDERGF